MVIKKVEGPKKISGPKEPVKLGTRIEVLAAQHPELVEQNAEMWGHDTKPTDAELTEFKNVRAQIQARKREIMDGMWAEHAKITAAIEASPSSATKGQMLEALDLAKKDSDTEQTLWELSCRCVEAERRGDRNPDLVEQHKLQTEIAELWPVRIWENVTPHAVSMRDKCTLTERVQQRALAIEKRGRERTALRSLAQSADAAEGKQHLPAAKKTTKTKKTLELEQHVLRAMTATWNIYQENKARDPTLKRPSKTDMHVSVLTLLHKKVESRNKNHLTMEMVKKAATTWKAPSPPLVQTVPAVTPKARHPFKSDI